VIQGDKMAKPSLWVRYSGTQPFELTGLGIEVLNERELTKEFGYSDIAEDEHLYNNIPNLEFSKDGGVLWETLTTLEVEEILSTFTLHDYNTKDIIAKKRNSFPSGVEKGHIIFHNILDDTFSCINGTSNGADTTQQINWTSITNGLIEIEGIDLKSTGIQANKILITNGSNGMVYGDINGGSL